MTRRHRLTEIVQRGAWLTASLGAWLAVVAAPAAQMDRGRVSVVEKSTDVEWLENIAASTAFATEVQGRSPIGMPKALRVAAYVRLGELGTPESLAAVARVEAAAAKTSLTPATVPADSWPTIGWHMGDMRVTPVAETNGGDGVTYAIVVSHLLGGRDFFLIASRTPADRRSWSRPKLVEPFMYPDIRDAVLKWRPDGTLTLSFAQSVPPPALIDPTLEPAPTFAVPGPTTIEIAVNDVLRDSDGDGWTDREEARLGLNPHERDTDGDGIPDGADVCPLYPAPSRPPTEEETILQKAIFAAFALSGSRELLFVTPGTTKVHVTGYAGPILYDHAIPRDGSSGGPYVSWKIVSKTTTEAWVELTDWEGMLAAGGQNVRLRKLAGTWVVVARQSTWVS